MEKLRVLIVDDSIVYRKILSAAVEATGLATATHTASNGSLALERLAQQAFDVVLTDVYMPEMDGIETLKRIKASYPQMVVIMVSGKDQKNAEVTLKALKAGAMDFIVKPLEENFDRNLKIVSDYLKVLFAQVRVKNLTTTQVSKKVGEDDEQQVKHPQPTRNKISGIDLVVIASSTGGPPALEEVVGKLGKGFTKPILIVQHMPPDFTKALAQTLDRKSEIHVIEGAAGDIVRAGQAILAPGGFHMVVRQEQSIRLVELTHTELVHGVRPSADVLFNSVADTYRGSRVLAVILTGMGNDGMAGVAEMKRKCRCYCISQNEATCVVYGMPRSVVEAGLSDESLEIGKIAERIRQIAENGS